MNLVASPIAVASVSFLLAAATTTVLVPQVRRLGLRFGWTDQPDERKQHITPMVRLGTAALTTRGFDAQAFREVADVIADRLLNPEDDAIRQRCLDRVAALCESFPLYADTKQPVLV